jgi:hypothetical protein
MCLEDHDLFEGNEKAMTTLVPATQEVHIAEVACLHAFKGTSVCTAILRALSIPRSADP